LVGDGGQGGTCQAFLRRVHGWVVGMELFGVDRSGSINYGDPPWWGSCGRGDPRPVGPGGGHGVWPRLRMWWSRSP
jgi:hypothetical protein